MTNENLVWHNPPKVGENTIDTVFRLSGFQEGHDYSNYRVLDFGCGKGRYLQVYSRLVKTSNLFGCDVDKDSVLEANHLGFNAIILDTNYASLPFQDESFDLIFSSNVIEHIPRSAYLVYIQEFYRVLRSSGRLVIGAPNYPIKRIYDIQKAYKNKEYWKYYLLDDPTHCNKQSIYKVENDLKKYFRDIRLEPSYFFFEKWIPCLKDPNFRYRIRILSDKFCGCAIKK